MKTCEIFFYISVSPDLIFLNTFLFLLHLVVEKSGKAEQDTGQQAEPAGGEPIKKPPIPPGSC